jgi:3-methyladenine DNA glycosylase/8-oxoguanine DNA glycosylase
MAPFGIDAGKSEMPGAIGTVALVVKAALSVAVLETISAIFEIEGVNIKLPGTAYAVTPEVEAESNDKSLSIECVEDGRPATLVEAATKVDTDRMAVREIVPLEKTKAVARLAM